MIGELLSRNLWVKAMCVELGHLAQGYRNTKGTDTINFMRSDKIPNIAQDRTVAYARIIVDYCEQNEDPNRVHITVGGNLIDYPYELTTRTVDFTTSKVK